MKPIKYPFTTDARSALRHLKHHPGTIARAAGFRPDVWVQWNGEHFVASAIPGVRGKTALYTITTNDVLDDWVVEESLKQPEFVEGGPDILYFPGAFMLPVISRLLEEVAPKTAILMAEPEQWSLGPVASMCSIIGWTCPKVLASVETCISYARRGSMPMVETVLVVDAETWESAAVKREALDTFKRVVVVRRPA